MKNEYLWCFADKETFCGSAELVAAGERRKKKREIDKREKERRRGVGGGREWAEGNRT